MHHLVVESTTSYSALRERMRAAPAGERILLLMQPGQSLPHGDVMLVLLRRLYDREQLEVGLVTDDPVLRREASALGLPAFRDIHSAEQQDSRWAGMNCRTQIGFSQYDAHRLPEVE